MPATGSLLAATAWSRSTLSVVDVTTPGTKELEAENERLRARIAALDEELAEQTARANAVVARAQERLFWLDRWHIDLNALMDRRVAQPVPWLVTQLLRARHRLQRVKRRLRN